MTRRNPSKPGLPGLITVLAFAQSPRLDHPARWLPMSPASMLGTSNRSRIGIGERRGRLQLSSASTPSWPSSIGQRGRGPDAIRLASLTPANTATDAPPAIKEAPAIGLEPFGLFTFRAPEGLLWRKWRGVEAAMVKEQTVLDRCRTEPGNCPSNAAQFLRLIDAVSSKSGREKLDEANRGVNTAIRYVSDYAQHGEADRWSAPLATFATAKRRLRRLRHCQICRADRRGLFPRTISSSCWSATAPSGWIMPCWRRASTAAG